MSRKNSSKRNTIKLAGVLLLLLGFMLLAGSVKQPVPSSQNAGKDILHLSSDSKKSTNYTGYTAGIAILIGFIAVLKSQKTFHK